MTIKNKGRTLVTLTFDQAKNNGKRKFILCTKHIYFILHFFTAGLSMYAMSGFEYNSLASLPTFISYLQRIGLRIFADILVHVYNLGPDYPLFFNLIINFVVMTVLTTVFLISSYFFMRSLFDFANKKLFFIRYSIIVSLLLSALVVRANLGNYASPIFIALPIWADIVLLNVFCLLPICIALAMANFFWKRRSENL